MSVYFTPLSAIITGKRCFVQFARGSSPCQLKENVIVDPCTGTADTGKGATALCRQLILWKRMYQEAQYRQGQTEEILYIVQPEGRTVAYFAGLYQTEEGILHFAILTHMQQE